MNDKYRLIEKIFYFKHVNKMQSIFKEIKEIQTYISGTCRCIRCYIFGELGFMKHGMWCSKCSYDILNVRVSLYDRHNQLSGKPKSRKNKLYSIYYPYSEKKSIKKYVRRIWNK